VALITVISRIRRGLRYPHVEVNNDIKAPIVIQFYPSFKASNLAARNSDVNVMMTTEGHEMAHKIKRLQSLTMLSLAKHHAGLPAQS